MDGIHSTKFSFSILALLLGFSLLVIPLGLASALGVVRGLSLSLIAVIIVLSPWKRGRPYLRLTIFWHLLLAVTIYVLSFIDLVANGPYFRWYNAHMIGLAENARLVGSNESNVERVLGSCYAQCVAADGRTMSYYYAPYPHLPLPMFFVRVHCTDGHVDWIEKCEEIEEEGVMR